MYPVTPLGKVSAVVAMIAGIALFSWVTAALASWFAESGSEKDAKKQRDDMQQQLRDMAEQLRLLQASRPGLTEPRADSRTGKSASPPLRSAEAVSATGSAAAMTAADVGQDREQDVGIEWGNTRWWIWTSKSIGSVYGRVKALYQTEAFWCAVSYLVYAAALAQAYFASDVFWRAAFTTVVLFGFVLLVRRPKLRQGWVLWATLLVLAIVLGADASSLSTLLVAGVGMSVVGVLLLLGQRPWTSSSPASSGGMTLGAATPQEPGAEED